MSNTTPNTPNSLSSDKDEFRNCVHNIFNNWSALQLAVDHGMGGSPQESNRKVFDMADCITNLCFSTNISDWEDIASELEDLMDAYFDTFLEDGSPDEVGQLLWDLSRKWLSGDKESALNYSKNLKKALPTHHVKSQMVPETLEEMETVEEEVSTSNIDSIPVDDGWTVVKKTRQRNH